MDPQPDTRTVELPMLAVRAAITPSSINPDARTVDVVFTTGAPVMRYDWGTGERYIERLSMDPKAVRLGRINGGGPVLDSHSGYRLANVLGVVQDNSARMDKAAGEGTATLRFSKRDDVTPIWQDVQDKVIRNVSVGYMVHAYQETAGVNGGPKTRLATDWEPYEISMVPMPADAGAQTRDGQTAVAMNPCQITVRGDAPTELPTQERQMEPNQASETIAEQNPLAATAQAARAAETVEPTAADLATRAERERVQGIDLACRAGRMTLEFRDKLVNEGVSLVEAQARVFKEMANRPSNVAGPSTTAHVRAGDVDNLVHVRAGIENAILHRVAPFNQYTKKGFELTEEGRQYRGMTLLDVARAYLQARNIRVTNMSKMEVAGMALGLDTRGGMQTTSDFANLLADVANKTLRKAYEESPATFEPFVRRTTAPDFKNINRVQLGDAPALSEVLQHGEFTRGKMLDGKEAYALKTYGKVFAITRQALVNDDTDAFSRVTTLFGASSRRLEADLVYACITGNPTMGDGNALFSAAHANLETDGDHIAIASLDRARKAMRVQTGLDATTLLNIVAKFLLVPAALETKAQQFTRDITPALATSVNPFTGLQVIAEPRLDSNSTTAWYLVASPDQIDTIELASLEGEVGPQLESRIGFDVDGLEIKCRMDAAAKAIDWRGFHKDPGDLDS